MSFRKKNETFLIEKEWWSDVERFDDDIVAIFDNFLENKDTNEL